MAKATRNMDEVPVILELTYREAVLLKGYLQSYLGPCPEPADATSVRRDVFNALRGAVGDM